MEQEWQRVSRRRRKKLRHEPMHFESAVSTTCRAACDVDEEVVESVPEISAAKQSRIIQRVCAIANVLQESLLLKDAVCAIVGHFHLIAEQTPVDEQIERVDVEDKTNDRLTLVSYGLGSFCASSNAVHQLGFLVALKQALSEFGEMPKRSLHSVEIFDPAMNKSDALIAEHFKLKVLEKNEHGRRQVVCNTVFFMPHCGKVLYENVLACNWGPAINKLVIIGNSFSAYGDRVVAAKERNELLIMSLLPYLKEVSLPCGVSKTHEDYARYEAAFNDLSVHRFPAELLDGVFDTATDLVPKMTALSINPIN